MKNPNAFRTKSGAHTKRYEAQVARTRERYRSEEETKKREEKEKRNIIKQTQKARRKWERARRAEYEATGRARPSYEEQWPNEYTLNDKDIQKSIDDWLENTAKDFKTGAYPEWEEYKFDELMDYIDSQIIKQGNTAYKKIWDNREAFTIAVESYISNQYEGNDDNNGAFTDAWDKIHSILEGSGITINEETGDVEL